MTCSLLHGLSTHGIGSSGRRSCDLANRSSNRRLPLEQPLHRQGRNSGKVRSKPKTQTQSQRQQGFRNRICSRKPVSLVSASLPIHVSCSSGRGTHSTSNLTPPSPLGHHFANPFLFFSCSNPSPSASLIHPFFLKYLPNFSTPSLT